MSARRDVYFPPRRHSDFTIHYIDTDFYVHQLVLDQQSAYFRACFLTQPVLAEKLEVPAGRKHKRARNEPAENASTAPSSATAPPSASTSATATSSSPSQFVQPPAESSNCSHSSLRHCIRLPDQLALANTSRDCDVDDFELFLRHLYLASHYRFPPFPSKTEVDLDAAPPVPLSLEFPARLNDEINEYTKQAAHKLVGNHRLPSLFHYFDCERAWKQSRAPQHDVGSNAFMWLGQLAPFGVALKDEEERLVQLAAEDTAISNNEWYKAQAKNLSGDLLLRVLVATREKLAAKKSGR